MKSAYELAMERLNKDSPAVKLSDEQKRQLAELDSRYTARIAEREISLKRQIADAAGRGELVEAEELQQELASETRRLKAELEEKKEQVRKAG